MSDNALQNKTEVLAPATNPNIDNSASTSAHPGGPDPTTAQSTTSKFHRPDAGQNNSSAQDATKGGVAAADASGSSQLASLKVKLNNNLRQYPNFPKDGILFEDIMPIFANHELHRDLITAVELLVGDAFNTRLGEKSDIDVIVGLESRGFLFGPTLALRYVLSEVVGQRTHLADNEQ